MENAIKYPKTMHLPWSPGLQNDDRVITSLDRFVGQEVVVTEKMDGENTSMYADGIHARSIDGRYHPSRDWVKKFWAENVAYRIPSFYRVCGENMYAQHSIVYNDLESYFYGFSLWDEEVCVGWDDTLIAFEAWGITPVPTLYRGTFSEEALRKVERNLNLEKQEGFVVRLVGSFTLAEFPTTVAKWVRKGHVQTDEHWMHKEVVPNGLKANA